MLSQQQLHQQLRAESNFQIKSGGIAGWWGLKTKTTTTKQDGLKRRRKKKKEWVGPSGVKVSIFVTCTCLLYSSSFSIHMYSANGLASLFSPAWPLATGSFPSFSGAPPPGVLATSGPLISAGSVWNKKAQVWLSANSLDHPATVCTQSDNRRAKLRNSRSLAHSWVSFLLVYIIIFKIKAPLFKPGIPNRIDHQHLNQHCRSSFPAVTKDALLIKEEKTKKAIEQ